MAVEHTHRWLGIREFYADKEVFITGVTGFMGKCLLEKILRSLPEVRRVLVLVRPKKGRSAKERIEDLLSCKVKRRRARGRGRMLYFTPSDIRSAAEDQLAASGEGEGCVRGPGRRGDGPERGGQAPAGGGGTGGLPLRCLRALRRAPEVCSGDERDGSEGGVQAVQGHEEASGVSLSHVYTDTTPYSCIHACMHTYMHTRTVSGAHVDRLQLLSEGGWTSD